MVTLAGNDTFFTNIDSDITQTQWESLIDQAIDKINGYARDDLLPNMTGTAGSKSVSVTSAQAGFIRSIAVAVYHREYKNEGAQSSGITVGGVSNSQSAGGAGANLESLAREAALCLKEIEVSHG